MSKSTTSFEGTTTGLKVFYTGLIAFLAVIAVVVFNMFSRDTMVFVVGVFVGMTVYRHLKPIWKKDETDA